MHHARGLTGLVLISALILSAPAFARKKEAPTPTIAPTVRHRVDANGERSLHSVATPTTTVIYEEGFDGPGGCTAGGWTSVDLTASPGPFFHVDDYAGLGAGFAPIAGAHSLWCGARPSNTDPLCGYATLPGYGNGWSQYFETKECIPVTGNLDVSFLMNTDSEPGYDATYLQYTADCSGATGWTTIDGGNITWDGKRNLNINSSYPVGGASEVRVRLWFASDGAFSDADGLFNSNGGTHIDNLAVEGLPLEDFEDEPAGATTCNDWMATIPLAGYGDFAGLVPGSDQLQQDPCASDLSCVWAFFVGSSYDYTCGGFPGQLVVPYKNTVGQYIHNEIRSPDIPITGSGGKLILEFSVYRDLSIPQEVFYLWSVRSGNPPCAGAWRNNNLRYYGDTKDWYVHREDISNLVNPLTDDYINIALGVRDFCEFYCGPYAPGDCHSHSPMFDNVRLLRVDEPQAPLWDIKEVEQFTDRFPTDGTITSPVQADAADGIDYARVNVADKFVGLAPDPLSGSGKAVYAYFSVWPQGQPGKSGANLTGSASNWPVVGSWTDASGISWTQIRMQAGVDGYTVDLRDDLFTPGDTVCFFYSARNNNGVENYAFGSDLSRVSFDKEEAAANPGEFTCFPAGGYNHGGDILYVNATGSEDARTRWETAFATMGLDGMVDRLDVRAPLSGPYLGGLVIISSISQLTTPYRKIVYDAGPEVGLPNLDNDFGYLGGFLDALTQPGGVYACGDDLPSTLFEQNSGSNYLRNNYIPFNLTSGDAHATYGAAPTGTPAGGSFFSDSFIILGTCPGQNDFDVIEPTGGSVMQVAYGTPSTDNGAVVSKATVNSHGASVGVVLSGFAFETIEDNDTDAILDRAQHLHDIITWLGNNPSSPTPANPRGLVTALAQNHPNPFNPQTTIEFSLRENGMARLEIYNVAGERVRMLTDGVLPAGSHEVSWDGRNEAGVPVSSGVYFYKLMAGDFAQTRKMVLLK